MIDADDFWKHFVAGFLELIGWSLVFILGSNSEAVKGFFVTFAEKDDGADAAVWFTKANLAVDDGCEILVVGINDGLNLIIA